MKKFLSLTLSLVLTLALLSGLFTVTAAAEAIPTEITLQTNEVTGSNYSTTLGTNRHDFGDYDYFDSFSIDGTSTISNGSGGEITVSISSDIVNDEEDVRITFSISASEWENAAPGVYTGSADWSTVLTYFDADIHTWDQSFNGTITIKATKIGRISDVSLSVEAPEAGQSADGLDAADYVTLDDGQHCSLVGADWGEKDGDTYDYFTGTFEAGKTYYISVKLEADKNYTFNQGGDYGYTSVTVDGGEAQDENLTVTNLSGQTGYQSYGTVIVAITIPEEESSEESSEPEESSAVEEESSEPEESEEENSEAESEAEESSESSQSSKPHNPGKPDEVSMGGGTAASNGGKESPDTGVPFAPLAAVALAAIAALAVVAIKKK